MSHLVTCPSQLAIQAYSTGLEELSSWMLQTNTDPVIHHHLLSVLSVRRSQPLASVLPYPCILSKRDYYDVFKTQEHIGWKQFTEGLISKQWAVLQHKYYQSIGVQRSGKTRPTHMLTKLWHEIEHIWHTRNNILHSNLSFLNQLHGQQYLDIAIKKEFYQGKGNLPSTLFPFFQNILFNNSNLYLLIRS
jgi:hypothetical protein